jgi:hypothetical protein
MDARIAFKEKRILTDGEHFLKSDMSANIAIYMYGRDGGEVKVVPSGKRKREFYLHNIIIIYVTYMVFYPPVLLGGMIKSYITL